MFRLSTNQYYNEWFESIEQFLNVLFNYKPKKNALLLRYFQNDILSFRVPKPY